jgi:flagellar biosynthetic protein FlhB
MAGGSENRTEKPTSRRLQKAREKGQVARSREVPSAFVLLSGLMILAYTAHSLVSSLSLEMSEGLRLRLPADINSDYISTLTRNIMARLAVAVAPLMLTAVAVSIVANLVQTRGFVFSTQALGFRFDKLSPKNGLSRVFSTNGLVELAKSLCLLTVVTIISYQVVSKHLALYPRLVLMDVRQLMHWTGTISYDVFLRVTIFLVVLAVFDYAFQKHRFTEQLKMTKQEVREEFKEMEGDPTTKGRIRRIQREMAKKRMMADVPKADVVITNPTHYAVALTYKMESMDAPKVVAKGVGFLALRIKDLARQHDIPQVENKALAQTLYKTVDVGETIPANLYKAVAEILAYIYKARNAWSRS